MGAPPSRTGMRLKTQNAGSNTFKVFRLLGTAFVNRKLSFASPRSLPMVRATIQNARFRTMNKKRKPRKGGRRNEATYRTNATNAKEKAAPPRSRFLDIC